MTGTHQLGHPDHPSRAARGLETLALAGILAVLAGRVFVGELPFRTSQLVLMRTSEDIPHRWGEELFRVSFAMVLLASAALWALSQCLRRRAALIAPVFGAGVLAFCGWSFVSAAWAVETRSALTGWLEMTSILLAAFVLMQLIRQGGRWRLLVAVLAAVGGTIALKGLAQATFEVADQVAEFEANPARQLAQVGISPGTPAAMMFEKRLRSAAPTGFFGLANVYASLLIVTCAAAVGLAIEKFAAARKAPPAPRARGEIHLPMLAAVLSIAPAVLAAALLVMTRSTGGIVAAAAALIGALAVSARAGFFRRHRRRLLIAAAAVAVAGICAVAAYGMKRGGLPGRSMQVRWEYWSGSASVIREAPLFGTGAANFGEAYLRHRLPAAAESPKYPHNVLCGSAAQFGLVGGGIFLGLIVWLLVALTRPGRREPAPPPGAAPVGSWAGARWCVFLAVAMVVVRSLWVGSDDHNALLIMAIIPGLVFCILLLASLWTGQAIGGAPATEKWTRIAIGAGACGFVVHNLVTYTVFTPATATAFFLAAAAAAGRGNLKARTLGRGPAIALAGLVLAGLIASGVWLHGPMLRRTVSVRAAQEAYSRGRTRAAIGHMRQAAGADELDDLAANSLARLSLEAVRNAPPEQVVGHLREAARAARLAWERSPTASNALWLAHSLRHWPAREDEALDMVRTAVRLDPMNVRTRIDYAGMLLQAGDLQAVTEQTRRARQIDEGLPPDSDVRLSPSEPAALKLRLLEGKLKQNRPVRP